MHSHKVDTWHVDLYILNGDLLTFFNIFSNLSFPEHTIFVKSLILFNNSLVLIIQTHITQPVRTMSVIVLADFDSACMCLW